MSTKQAKVKQVSHRVLAAITETIHLVMSKQSDKVTQIVDACMHTYKRDGQFIFMGNGGSAANASHFAADFTKRPIWHIKNSHPISTRALTDSSEATTMWSNDAGYEDVFHHQLMSSQLTEKDIIFAFSGSGNSKNVLKAVRLAKKKGARVIAITGFDGGKLAPFADVSIIVPPGPNRDLETDDEGAVAGAYEAVTDVIMHAVIEGFRESIKSLKVRVI